jgi:hypothetical protein
MSNRLLAHGAPGNQKRGQLGAPDQRSGKYPSNTKCSICGLLFQDGVWKRGKATNKGQLVEKMCPACIQIRSGQIGGIVEFSGAFAGNHRQELLNRIRNLERLIKEERPLERIVEMKEKEDRIVVSATTEHLVARIGKAIQRDFGGELNLRYSPEDKFAVAHWHRDG